MQMKWSALGSSLVLGAVWALWHLPLFFIDGIYQNNLGVGTLFFWIFMLEIIPKTILITWIYNNNQRSTLSAVLLHFMDNFIGELFELTKQAELNQFITWIAAAIVVTVVWGPKTLTRENNDE
jgi:membrane protease YdiL (CAAX protease family)